VGIKKSRIKALMYNAFKAGFSITDDVYNGEYFDYNVLEARFSATDNPYNRDYIDEEVDLEKKLNADFDAFWKTIQHEYPCDFREES
jgi:hypothetical protein